MKIAITDINRNVIKFYGDNDVQGLTTSNEYNIGFTVESKGSYMDTDVDVTYDGHMSFDKAQQMVEDKLGIRGG